MAQRVGVGSGAFLEPWSRGWSAPRAAATLASDPATVLRPVIGELGFDGLSCIALVRTADGGERAIDVWSTARPGWAERYRDRGYADVDPRVTMTAPRLSPVIWDAADVEAGRTVRHFLADAARFGVRSGFAVSVRDVSQLRIGVAFDSASSPLSEPGCIEVPSPPVLSLRGRRVRCPAAGLYRAGLGPLTNFRVVSSMPLVRA